SSPTLVSRCIEVVTVPSPTSRGNVMTQTPPRSTSALWARFRFSVVGSLLSSPPARGALKTAIRCLAEKTWCHPVSGCDVQFSAVTIERWYYTARRGHDDPVGVLRRAVRKDCGKVSLATAVAERLILQYHDHQHWSYQLHYDNLAALVKADPSLGPFRSYSTVRRGPRGKEAPDARDPQLRGRVRRVSVASRFPPRIAQGAHSRRPVAAPHRAGHPR